MPIVPQALDTFNAGNRHKSLVELHQEKLAAEQKVQPLLRSVKSQQVSHGHLYDFNTQKSLVELHKEKLAAEKKVRCCSICLGDVGGLAAAVMCHTTLSTFGTSCRFKAKLQHALCCATVFFVTSLRQSGGKDAEEAGGAEFYLAVDRT